MKGLFITFEGTEGSGKSTQIKILAERLASLGRKTRILREPGGTLIGEEIRHLLKNNPNNTLMCAEAEVLLFNASRAQLVREVIQPALANEEVVLCDRFYDSTIAYQGFGRKLGLAFVEPIIKAAIGELRPDLTLFLSVSPETSEKRQSKRQNEDGTARDRIEKAGRAFFDGVDQGYQYIAKTEPDRFQIIDANDSVSEVSSRVWNHVNRLLESL
jgi:dTMP kinase